MLKQLTGLKNLKNLVTVHIVFTPNFFRLEKAIYLPHAGARVSGYGCGIAHNTNTFICMS